MFTSVNKIWPIRYLCNLILANNITLTNLELQDLLGRQKLKHVDEIAGFDSEVSNEVAEKEYLTGILRAHVISAHNIKGKPGGH